MRATPIRTVSSHAAPPSAAPEAAPRVVVRVGDLRSVQFARVEALPPAAPEGAESELDERERLILEWARANPGWRTVQELRRTALGGQSDGHKARKSVPGLIRRMQRLGLLEHRGGDVGTFQFRARRRER